MKTTKPIQWIADLTLRAMDGDLDAVSHMSDALEREVRARSREQGANNDRYAFAVMVASLHDVFPDLSLTSKPWTVASYVKTLVEKYTYAVAEKQRIEATVEFARALDVLKEVKVTQ